MPMTLNNTIFVGIGVRDCQNILLGVNTVKADVMQMALNQIEM